MLKDHLDRVLGKAAAQTTLFQGGSGSPGGQESPQQSKDESWKELTAAVAQGRDDRGPGGCESRVKPQVMEMMWVYYKQHDYIKGRQICHKAGIRI